MSKGLPKRSVCQAFILWRIPAEIPIERETLLANLEKDIERAEETHDFVYADFSRRETPQRSIKFLLQRGLLTERRGLISRNDKTKRYIAKLPQEVVDLIEALPVSDPLMLLAGARSEDD